MGHLLSSLLLLFAAGATPVQFTIAPQPGKFFEAVFVGPAPEVSPGEFRGTLALNGSPFPMSIAGRAEKVGTRLRVRTTLRYADVPSEWTSRFRTDAFQYQIRGRVEGSGSIDWEGSLAWEQVSVGGDQATLSGFVRLTSFELTELSPKQSTGRAVLRVENPFSFPITIASASYRLKVNEHSIGSGISRGRILRAQRANAVELPFTVSHGGFLAAAGSAFAVGAELDGRIEGVLVVRLPSGDVRVPLDLSGTLGTDGARSGVFSFPEGGTSLSPRR